MRFYVVDPLAPKPRPRPVDCACLPDAPSVKSIMWMPFPRSLDATQLDTFVTSSAESVTRSDVVAVGLHSKAAKTVLESAYVLDDVARRVSGALLLVVYSEDGTPVVKHVRGDAIDGLESASTLDVIREQDVADLVRRPGAELPIHPGIHYEGPNGDHYEAFLRPGFGARSIEELDRLAFWLAPKLRGRQYVMVDHWSMIRIAYHVGSYLADLGELGAMRVANLRAYDEDRDVLVRRLENAFGSIDPSSGAVLVSVNSSGRLVRDVLLPAMETVGFRNTLGIALTRTPDPSEYKLPSLTVLNETFRRYRPAECPACRRGKSAVIPIQHDSYLLTLAAYTQSTAIARRSARKSTEVVERYRGKNAFWVHRTHSDGRHHAYFVDLGPVLGHDTFRERVARTVRPWRRVGIDLVLHPDHYVAARLAKMVAEELGVVDVMECHERGLGNLTPQRNEMLARANRICLVDDVVISGARIFGYRTEINSTRRNKGTSECELYCLIGMARPTDPKALMGVTDVLHHTSTQPRFLSVERLFLPNWDQSVCRWCAELRLLNDLPEEMQSRGPIRARLTALRKPGGLVDGLFLPWTGSAQGNDFWRLGPNSIFGDVQKADLAVSVAAAIQQMRGEHPRGNGTWEESKLDEEFRSPVAKVLDPKFYLGGRYYEPVIVASILRASRGHDLRAPGDDTKLRSRIRMVASANSSTELHGELALAAAMDQLPRIRYAFSKANLDIAMAIQRMLR